MTVIDDLVAEEVRLDSILSLLTEAQSLVNNRYFTLAYVLGPGSLSYVAQAVVLLFAAVVAYVNRRASYARLIALGVVASAFGATYWHLQDFTILVAAIWLFWRERPPIWQKLLVAVLAICAELAWPLRPLPLLVAVRFPATLPPHSVERPRQANYCGVYLKLLMYM